MYVESGWPSGMKLPQELRELIDKSQEAMQTVRSSQTEPLITDTIMQKIASLQRTLHVESLEEALDKSLNIAHFVAETINDRDAKLLVERRGRLTQLKEIA
jgi:hypothetical protein